MSTKNTETKSNVMKKYRIWGNPNTCKMCKGKNVKGLNEQGLNKQGQNLLGQSEMESKHIGCWGETFIYLRSRT